MTYFSLGCKSEKPLNISFLPGDSFPLQVKTQDFSQLDGVKVGFFRPSNKEDEADILQSPCFLFSDTVKLVLDTFHQKETMKKQYLAIQKEEDLPPFAPLSWSCLQVVPDQEEIEVFPRYWILDMAEVFCVHADSQFYPNGSIETLVLDLAKIPPIPCFRVGGILETRVILSLELAESVLQSCPFAVTLDYVEVT